MFEDGRTWQLVPCKAMKDELNKTTHAFANRSLRKSGLNQSPVSPAPLHTRNDMKRFILGAAVLVIMGSTFAGSVEARGSHGRGHGHTGGHGPGYGHGH